MSEREFIDRVQSIGGRVYLVGGAVRDKLRGVRPKDRDYCITGVTEDQFVELFPNAKKVGISFPVFLMRLDEQSIEVAFARREKKSGTGYRGFTVIFDPSVSIEEDLFRRDTTINAIAIELPSGRLIDPFGGAADISAKKIRAVSEHFVDDPVRALRAARQAAEFHFEITPETLVAMNKCGAELALEPADRIVAELHRALSTEQPSSFFRALESAGLLSITFPELHQLIGKTQPTAYHPEGDSFEHTMKIVDDVSAMSDEPMTRFCALVHDLGKGTTPLEMLPHHYGHDKRGLEVLDAWNARTTLPRDWIKAARLVIAEHMRAAVLEQSGKIVDLLMKLHASILPIAEFNKIIRADNRGMLPYYLEHAEELISAFLTIGGRNCPPEIVGEKIGAWIRNERIKILSNFKQLEGF